jgi:hypothetical protein
MAFPTSPIDGQIATVNNIRYVYAAATSSWTRLLGTKYVAAASSPSNPNLGDQWYNTGTDALYEYINDGTTSYWVDVSSGGAGNISLVGDSTLQGNITLGVNSRYSIGSNVGYLQNIYANLSFANVATVGNVITTSGVFWANGVSAVGPIYGNTQVAAYLASYTGAIAAANITLANIVATNNVFVSATTLSTSTGTGALVVNGGLGLAGNLTLGSSIVERIFTITDGASVSIDPVNGTMQLWTLGASRTPTAVNFANGQSVTLTINSGIYSITWTSVPVTWITATAPTLSTTALTIIALWKANNVIYGTSVGTT